MTAVALPVDDAADVSRDVAVWDDALLAARLFAVNPSGLCGIAVRAAASPVRDLWLEYLRGLLEPGTPVRRLPSGIGDDRLLGGIDLAATLKAGRPIVQHGILIEANGGIVVIPMAERLQAGTAARIAAVLDCGEVAIERDGLTRRVATQIGVVALDEGAAPEEQLPAALAQRFAFHIDLQAMPWRELAVPKNERETIAQAQAQLARVAPASREMVEALVRAALSFGIDSVVAPLLALRAARAAAAIAGRAMITREDAVLAARLVLAPRATQVPQDNSAEQDDAPPPEPETQEPPPESNEAGDEEQSLDSLDDMICEAVQAMLPQGLLDSLKTGAKDRTAPGPRGGTATARLSLTRGRPVGARAGSLKSGARLALVETLRAAAPWQPVRRKERGDTDAKTRRIDIRSGDFRIKQFAQQRESTIVFCVDASGSAAFHRLAEAKGAVELLLGEAYVARTYAALVAFRGTVADVLLPPSRSLTRARSLLSTLPGGGGTPLAAGIEAAMLVALGERAKGREPLIVFLTDGQANIGRDGKPARPGAFEDALVSARQMKAQRLASVFVDTSVRARNEGKALADAMGARYLALPHVQAEAVRDAVRAAAP